MQIEEELELVALSPRAANRKKSDGISPGGKELNLVTEPVLQDESKIQYQILKSANQGEEPTTTDRQRNVKNFYLKPKFRMTKIREGGPPRNLILKVRNRKQLLRFR